MTDNDHNDNDNNERVFSVLVDGSPAMNRALYYASLRASSINGRVALVYIIDDSHVDNMFGVGDIFRQEAKEEGDKLVEEATRSVTELTQKEPHIYFRTGATAETFMQLIKDENIDVVVLGIDDGNNGPGMIISYLIKVGFNKMEKPFIFVPASMGYQEISHITNTQ